MGDTTSEKLWPGLSDEAHPELFTVAPPLVGPRKPGMLSDQQIRQYFDQGYVIVEDFIPREYLDACKASLTDQVDELARKLHTAGKIPSLFEEYGFFQRLTKMNEAFPGTSVILHKSDDTPKAVRDLWSYEKLLDVAEQVLGTTEIVGHPVWNLRPKTPNTEAVDVPWHQDSAYLENETYGVHQMTAWIPLLDTNENNGCMQMVKNGHRSGKIALHTCCWAGTWYVMLDGENIKKTLGVDLEENTVTCEVPYGGVLFFSNSIPHRSLPNMSNNIRWSFDLRWQSADKPVGFYGLKDGVLLRSSRPDFAIDWDSWADTDRWADAKTHDHQQGAVNNPDLVGAYSTTWHSPSVPSSTNENEFDTTITGPWMKKWEIVNKNEHTEPLGKAVISRP